VTTATSAAKPTVTTATSAAKPTVTTATSAAKPTVTTAREVEELYCRCPHCGIVRDITQINCGIFRCALVNVKEDSEELKSIDPHATKETCDRLLKECKIVSGCSRPFQVVRDKDKKLIFEDYSENMGGKIVVSKYVKVAVCGYI
jgi:hypothetical protein